MAFLNMFVFFVIIIPFHTVYCQNLYVNPTSCKDGKNTKEAVVEYFNTATMKCESCAQNSTFQQRSADGLFCECKPGYKYLINRGGKEVNCEYCPGAVSDDGWECVNCSNFDTETKKCNPCPEDSIGVFRQLDGQYGIGGQNFCIACTNGTQRDSTKPRCYRCSDTINITGNSLSCACVSGSIKVKGICLTRVDVQDTAKQIQIEKTNTAVTSSYLTLNLQADYMICNELKNITACQSLANMCALILYRGGLTTTYNPPNACTFFAKVDQTQVTTTKPTIFNTDAGDRVLYIDNLLNIQWTVDPAMKFPFVVGQFSLEGLFEGFQDMTGRLLQLCEADENVLNAAFVFGTYYSYKCSISVSSLMDQTLFPLKFYEVFIKFTDSGTTKTLKIPVKILNFINNNGEKVNQGIMQKWQLAYRFFLVDSIGAREQIDKQPVYVRYAKNIRLLVELRADSADGKTYIPYFEIEYAEASLTDNQVDISFQVSYSMSQSSYTRNFQIATGTLSSFALLYAGFRTYVWSRRAGRISIDFPTLANFIFYLCASLSNCFFVIVYGVGFYFFIFYKRQNVIYLVHPDGQAYEDWIALFGAAFALKALALFHMIVMQCSADVFLIDWERPKSLGGNSGDGKKQKSMVSIWRTYFVANEWNEIQTKRKINQVFQIFAVVFFLVVVGFEDTTTMDPDGTVNKASDVYMSQQSKMYRMALAATVYILIGIVQMIFFLFIYERFITDDIREFVDICSISNISVFIMANAEFGYYIHGRSVHGCSDVGMDEMSEMIKREEDDLVGQRGLVPNTDAQTFVMAIPKRLREKYTAVYMPVQLENATSRMGKSSANKDKSTEAYLTLNRFFSAFIDHSIRDIDYVVKDKNFLEKLLDTEFLELTDKGIFYNDNGHSFDNVLFYGNELMLLIFDLLLFCIIDLICMDYVLAGVLTYVITELICLIRDTAGKKNLARKTLVDERFLI